MSQFKNGGTPRFMRRFKRLLTIQDLLTGRKTAINYTDLNGILKRRLETNPKPQFESRLAKNA